MKRLRIIVEGQTEEAFVRDVLAPWLGERGLYATAQSVETGRSQGRIHRGGLTSYAKARRDLVRCLADTNVLVSTMFDYYALPSDFPLAPGTWTTETPHEWARRVEDALAADLGTPARFVPYVQMHEFETLLFADPEKTARAIGLPELGSRLAEIGAAFPSPEHINDGRDTAPSKRLKAVIERYDKPAFGASATAAIGMEKLRAACPHFADWVNRLLAASASVPEPVRPDGAIG